MKPRPYDRMFYEAYANKDQKDQVSTYLRIYDDLEVI